LTRRINGGTNGLADRERRWAIARLAPLAPRAARELMGTQAENPSADTAFAEWLQPHENPRMTLLFQGDDGRADIARFSRSDSIDQRGFHGT
jgi:hypothetical protein